MKKIFVFGILVLILVGFVGGQERDTGQVGDVATYQSQVKGSIETRGNKDENSYEKTLSIANMSIIVAMVVLGFVALLAAVVGAYGISKTRRIDREVKEQFDKVEKSKEKMETAVDACLDRVERKMERLEAIGEKVEKLRDEVEEHIKYIRIERKTFEESVNKFKEEHLVKPEEVPKDFSKKVAELPEKDPKTAIEAYEKLQDEIFGEDIYWAMAYNYYKLGQFEKSRNEFEKYIKMNPEGPGGYYNWGLALQDLADLKKDEALYHESFDKYALAVKYKKDYHEAYNNWGVALIAFSKLKEDKQYLKEALEKIEKAIGIKKDDADYWYNKACAHSLLEEKDKALESLKRAIDLDTKCKEEANKDEDFKDFKDLWEDPEFKKLVGSAH